MPRLLPSDTLLASLRTLARRFAQDNLAQTAGSLTFTILISLVPLLTDHDQEFYCGNGGHRRAVCTRASTQTVSPSISYTSL